MGQTGHQGHTTVNTGGNAAVITAVDTKIIPSAQYAPSHLDPLQLFIECMCYWCYHYHYYYCYYYYYYYLKIRTGLQTF